MKGTFIVQDRVIKSLKEGQDALDRKIYKISSQGEEQIKFMTNLLTDFKQTMMGATGAHY